MLILAAFSFEIKAELALGIHCISEDIYDELPLCFQEMPSAPDSPSNEIDFERVPVSLIIHPSLSITFFPSVF